ncbi:MAG: GatB/YqeY domain-containing protein [Candidatus Omnitrophica bacterium]|nr:GatB/YqeY domain-containing protein [Candidatus Omnitrophota bacterium]
MLEEKIYQDFIAARKAKEKVSSDLLGIIRSELKNKAIDLKKDKVDDTEGLTGLKKQQKRLLDTKKSIAQSQRNDLIANTNQEIALLEKYLPKPLADDELIKIIEIAISDANASSIKDMGRVMKEVIAKVGVRADSKKVSQIVKEKLSA